MTEKKYIYFCFLSLALVLKTCPIQSMDYLKKSPPPPSHSSEEQKTSSNATPKKLRPPLPNHPPPPAPAPIAIPALLPTTNTPTVAATATLPTSTLSAAPSLSQIQPSSSPASTDQPVTDCPIGDTGFTLTAQEFLLLLQNKDLLPGIDSIVNELKNLTPEKSKEQQKKMCDFITQHQKTIFPKLAVEKNSIITRNSCAAALIAHTEKILEATSSFILSLQQKPVMNTRVIVYTFDPCDEPSKPKDILAPTTKSAFQEAIKHILSQACSSPFSYDQDIAKAIIKKLAYECIKTVNTVMSSEQPVPAFSYSLPEDEAPRRPHLQKTKIALRAIPIVLGCAVVIYSWRATLPVVTRWIVCGLGFTTLVVPTLYWLIRKPVPRHLN